MTNSASGIIERDQENYHFPEQLYISPLLLAGTCRVGQGCEMSVLSIFFKKQKAG